MLLYSRNQYEIVQQLKPKIKKNFHGQAESSDFVSGEHKSAFSLIAGFLTKTNFLSTNNDLLDIEFWRVSSQTWVQ